MWYDDQKMLANAIKDVLTHWRNNSHLLENDLAHLITVDKTLAADPDLTRVDALRQVISECIQELGVADEEPPQTDSDLKWKDKAWRYHNIPLAMTKGLTPVEVALHVQLSPETGHFYRERHKAIKMLGQVLRWRERRGQPEEEQILFPSGALPLLTKRYVEREADRTLKRHSGYIAQTFIIRGPRQMGKTSLLLRIGEQLRREYSAQTVFFDIQGIEANYLHSLDNLLYQLASIIAHELDLDPDPLKKAWQDTKLSAAIRLERWLEKQVLQPLSTPLVFALDEVDRLLTVPYRRDFFSMLRTWHNKRADPARSVSWGKLSLILVISTEPYLLIDNPLQSPFNVGEKIELRDFGETEVRTLNQQYGYPLADDEVPQLMAYLNGHPFLTSLALFHMTDTNSSWLDLVAATARDGGPFGEHLRHLYYLLNQDNVLKKSFSKVVHDQAIEDDWARFRLLKAGLIKPTDSGYQCRCELYRRYFDNRI